MKGLKAGTEIFTILFAFGEKYEKLNGLGFVSPFFRLFVDKNASFQNKQRVKGKQTQHGSNATKGPALKGPANEKDFLSKIDSLLSTMRGITWSVIWVNSIHRSFEGTFRQKINQWIYFKVPKA
jgi:hypothetical protein